MHMGFVYVYLYVYCTCMFTMYVNMYVDVLVHLYLWWFQFCLFQLVPRELHRVSFAGRPLRCGTRGQ